MIFVTVGTDQHPFNRLIKKVDSLQEKGMLDEDIFIQTGYSDYKPQFCQHAEFLPFEQMLEKIREARIVITHGGPGSIMPVIYTGNVPIVVTRRKNYGEVVDDHQVYFVKKLKKQKQIISVDNIEELEHTIKNYDDLVIKLKLFLRTNAPPDKRIAHFVRALDEICEKFKRKKKR